MIETKERLAPIESIRTAELRPSDNPVYEFSSDVVCLSAAKPREVESIRTVRTHLIARHIEDGRRGLALCAATPGVGCTFSAVNLAVALSQAGISTLLIDADLRRPQVDQFIRPQERPSGLAQLLAATDAQASNFVQPNVLPNLSIVYSGGPVENAQELLAREAFRRFLDQCLRDYEFTIIDTPPISACSDALRVSKIVGYTLVVARTNFSRTEGVSSLARQLREDGAAIVGTILYDR